MTYYEWPPDGVIRTNSTEYRDFNGLELVGRKRFSDRWMMNTSLALGRTIGYLPPGSFNDPTNVPFQDGAPDNSRNATWIFKLSGMYALPAGVNVSGFLNAREGLPFFRSAQSPSRRGGIGLINAKYEPDATARHENFTQVDVRVEKSFRLRKARLTGNLDVFNRLFFQLS